MGPHAPPIALPLANACGRRDPMGGLAMRSSRTRIAAASVFSALLLSIPAVAQEGQTAGPVKLYNSAKQKLLDGKQINGHTISRFDPKAYCEAAPHYDFTWFEMQHSTMP